MALSQTTAVVLEVATVAVLSNVVVVVALSTVLQKRLVSVQTRDSIIHHTMIMLKKIKYINNKLLIYRILTNGKLVFQSVTVESIAVESMTVSYCLAV